MSKTQRLITLILAILFLATSVGFTILVIAEMNKDDEPTIANESSNQNQEGSMDLGKLDNFEPGDSVPTLQVITLMEGTGAAVKSGNTVSIHYTGALVSDGSIFDSSVSRGEPFKTLIDPTANLIEGWKQGIINMKVGGKYRLLIPSNLGYGEMGSPPVIPANSDLVFDIEIISIDG